jgi:hypothetical protein
MPTFCLLVCPAFVAPRGGRAFEHRAVRRAPVPRDAGDGHDDAVSIASASSVLARGLGAFALSATIALGDPALSPALAGTPKGQGVLSTDEYGRVGLDRCGLEALKKGASTRAAFSDFATQQNAELYVNIEGCDYSNLDLSNEVLSGVKARGANFENSIFGAECSRADFSDANLRGTKMRSANLYNTNFAGADLENADLTGALASGAFFGKDPQTGNPANLKGTVFEDTLLSSSDVQKMCANKTLDFEGKMSLGC